jgi:hypothetical protein
MITLVNAIGPSYTLGTAAPVYAQQIATLIPGTNTTTTTTTTGVLEMIGQQFFKNGTGIAYFNDNSTRPFTHAITPENGFYYDNSTVFLDGDVPGVSIKPDEFYGLMTGNTTIITIPNGAGLLPPNQKFQPNLVTVKVGDTIQFLNNDYKAHRVVSPPDLSVTGANEEAVPSGANFDETLYQGDQSDPIVISRPGGFHFNDFYVENATGTIIAVE